MDQARISVIICARNPREDYFNRVLRALDRQTLPKDEWELILVDNGSVPGLSSRIDLSWHSRALHVREEQAGIINARARGIRQSSGDLIVFVDDDNVIEPDYLEVVKQLSIDFKQLGCWGCGSIKPEFEKELDSSLDPYAWMLAVRVVTRPIWMSHPAIGSQVPWGAGLVVRRSVAIAYCKSIEENALKKELGRSGHGLGCGEDDEISWVAGDLGMGCGVFPTLKMIHLIRKERLNIEYFIKMRQGHAYSHFIMDYLHGKPISQPAEQPRFSKAFLFLVRGQISGFLGQLHGAWVRHRDNSLDKLFAEAALRGKKSAWEMLKKRGALK